MMTRVKQGRGAGERRDQDDRESSDVSPHKQEISANCYAARDPEVRISSPGTNQNGP
jgi:hypothetical protein